MRAAAPSKHAITNVELLFQMIRMIESVWVQGNTEVNTKVQAAERRTYALLQINNYKIRCAEMKKIEERLTLEYRLSMTNRELLISNNKLLKENEDLKAQLAQKN